MRLYFIALLAATVLHACISAATTSKLTVADYPAVIHSLADNEIGVPPTRMLRSYEATDVSDEERAGNVLDKVVGAAKSGIASTKIKYWSSKDQTPADVLKMLKLGDDAAAALENPKLKALTKSIASYNKKYPNRELSLVETLVAHYGDDAVAKALVSATKDSNTENVLLRADIRSWLKDYAYWALRDSRLEFFTKYASHFNEKFPDNKVSLIGALTKRFGDIDVTTALASAKAQKDKAGVIAKQLWTEQQPAWLNSGKSVDDVFTLLKIRNDEYWGNAAKKLNALDDYVRLHNGGKSGGDTLVNAVSRGFGGEGEWAKAILTLMKRQDKLANTGGFVKANADAFGQFTAKKMQTALFEHWWNQNLQPANVGIKFFKNEKNQILPKTVISLYNKFYERKMKIFPANAEPRRS
uniref:RxLR effector protein n=1 Tax=Phytophthora agathidicida TaxID=1642459 RepID=A0A7G4WI59_9STRA|nr:PaRXLR70 [Phytophthora agathidicida]